MDKRIRVILFLVTLAVALNINTFSQGRSDRYLIVKNSVVAKQLAQVFAESLDAKTSTLVGNWRVELGKKYCLVVAEFDSTKLNPKDDVFGGFSFVIDRQTGGLEYSTTSDVPARRFYKRVEGNLKKGE